MTDRPRTGGPAPVRVRPAVPGDAAELHALSLRAIRESAAGHYSSAQLEAWARMRTVEGHRRLVRDARTFVASTGGAVSGFVTLRPAPDEPATAEVDQLFVDPRAGGRGVARALLAAAHAAAAGAGYRRVVAHASWRAVPVLERCGYRQVRTESVRLGAEVLTRALMVGDLPEQPDRPPVPDRSAAEPGDGC